MAAVMEASRPNEMAAPMLHNLGGQFTVAQVKLAIRNGVDPSGLLLRLIGMSSLDAIQYLCEEIQVDVNTMDSLGNTALILAVRASSTVDQSELLAYLVERANANVDLGNKKGTTPLMLSSEYGNEGVTEYLIRAGADVNSESKRGDTALSLAAYGGYLGIVKRLVAAGANLNSKRVDGSTPLTHAAVRNRLDIVKYLVVSGADINAQDKNGFTPLISASLFNNKRVASYLVDAKADVFSRCKGGLCAKEHAERKGFSKLSMLLGTPSCLIAIRRDLAKLDVLVDDILQAVTGNARFVERLLNPPRGSSAEGPLSFASFQDLPKKRGHSNPFGGNPFSEGSSGSMFFGTGVGDAGGTSEPAAGHQGGFGGGFNNAGFGNGLEAGTFDHAFTFAGTKEEGQEPTGNEGLFESLI